MTEPYPALELKPDSSHQEKRKCFHLTAPVIHKTANQEQKFSTVQNHNLDLWDLIQFFCLFHWLGILCFCALNTDICILCLWIIFELLLCYFFFFFCTTGNFFLYIFFFPKVMGLDSMILSWGNWAYVAFNFFWRKEQLN